MAGIFGPMAMTPEEQAADGSLLGLAMRNSPKKSLGERALRGLNNFVSDKRAMAGLGGIAQGLLQAGAVSSRPISNAEAMALASQGASGRLDAYDQNRQRRILTALKARQLEQSGRPDIGSYNPRDYTTDSFSRFVQTGDPSVLERYEGARTVMVAGVPHVFDPSSGRLVAVRTAEDVGTDKATVESLGAEGRERGKLAAQRELLPDVKAAVAAAEAEAKAVADAGVEARSNDRALATYNSAMDGLVSAMEGTTTGPGIGRLPAVTAEAQIAEGAVAAMAPVLKSIFRVAGEGVFTDRDQDLLMSMVPSRSDLPEARAAKVQAIDAIVRAKLGPGGAQRVAGQPQGAAPQAAAPQSSGIKFLGFE